MIAMMIYLVSIKLWELVEQNLYGMYSERACTGMYLLGLMKFFGEIHKFKDTF